MPEVLYYRRGKVIRNTKTGEDEVLRSVNAAKRRSAELQKQHGQFCIRTCERFPARPTQETTR